MAERITGKVKWFNAIKGYGFISQENGADVFVHHSSIRVDGYPKLSEGQQVEYSIEVSVKGLLAVDVIAL